MLVLNPMTRPTQAAAPPVHSLAVSGPGVAMYPAFSAATARYGVTTTDATGGAVVVTASTNDPLGSVWVDGRVAAHGTATVTGLTTGDEIAIFIVDSAGTAVYSLVYLPAKFPTLSVVGNGTPAGGHVLLGLTRFSNAFPTFETAIDRNGVPAFVRSSMDGSLDLKRLANGHYSVSRQTPSVGRTGSLLVELDDQFRQIATYETAPPLIDTDGHDSILRPDGSRILVAYEPNAQSGKIDAVIQEVNAQGEVVFTWNSQDHVLPTDGVGDAHDYAHINSITIMDDGDILASFRHLSQVMKIARTAHGEFAQGDVVWRLGGRRSDFTFVDDGPCAQHTATQLANGHILIFDNGSSSGGPMCIDPADRSGTTIARPQTRVSEYLLDTEAHTAARVWSYQVPGRFAVFAGSAQRLDNGDTMVGWAAAKDAIATLVDPEGQPLWELADVAQESSQRYVTYRAAAATVPDDIKPAVDVVAPEQGASYTFGQAVTSDFGCTDRGGANLVSCLAGGAHPGAALDTTVAGAHAFTVRAIDGEGNATSVTRNYHVAAPPVPGRPDAMIRKRPGGRQVGSNIYGGSAKQGVRQAVSDRARSARAVVRFQNDGNRTDAITVHGTDGSRAYRVRYFAAGTDVTRRVTAGTYRTPSLLPGQVSRLRIKVTRTGVAKVGDHRTVRVRGRSVGDAQKRDAVRTFVHLVR